MDLSRMSQGYLGTPEVRVNRAVSLESALVLLFLGAM